MIRQAVDDLIIAKFLDSVVISTVSCGIDHSPPHGLEPATHKIEALAERYLNGSQRILDN